MSIPLISPIDPHYRKTSLPLSRPVLKVPAEFALRSLLASRIDHMSSWGVREHVSEDVRHVLNACKALQQYGEQDNTILDDAIVAATAHTLVGSLSDDTLLKLSLITWHFDGSLHSDASSYALSPALARFLKQPNDDTIWKSLHDRYQSETGRQVSLPAFKASHGFLLCATLGPFLNGA